MAAALRNLVTADTKISTSPAASGSNKRSLLTPDPTGESQWTSLSTPAYINLSFPEPLADATHFAITFQGGFAGTSMMLYFATPAGDEETERPMLGMMLGGKVWAEDTSKRQVFEIPYPAISLSPPEKPTDDNASLKSGAASIRSVATTASARTKRGAGWTVPGVTDIKIEFEKSSDNQGRVTVYSVEILTAA